MIKVIKHGTKVFKETCPVCGCEFEYEYEDLIKEYGFVKMVKCPDCGEMIYHKDYKEPKIPQYPDYPFPTIPTYPDNPITKPYVTWDIDCQKCPNYHYQTTDKTIVGDTPCTLCKKNQPYCVSTGSSTKLDFTTVTVDDKHAQTSYSDYAVTADSKEKDHD